MLSACTEPEFYFQHTEEGLGDKRRVWKRRRRRKKRTGREKSAHNCLHSDTKSWGKTQSCPVEKISSSLTLFLILLSVVKKVAFGIFLKDMTNFSISLFFLNLCFS